MLVERSCYDQALEIAKAAADGQQVGDPSQEGDHIGPMFDRIQFDRVQTMIQKGIDEGATLLAGGLGRPEGLGKGWYVRPTVFADVTNDMAIAQQEIFGPVLVIIPFEDEEDAIRIANDTPYGLAAYLQTGDPERAERGCRPSARGCRAYQRRWLQLRLTLWRLQTVWQRTRRRYAGAGRLSGSQNPCISDKKTPPRSGRGGSASGY